MVRKKVETFNRRDLIYAVKPWDNFKNQIAFGLKHFKQRDIMPFIGIMPLLQKHGNFTHDMIKHPPRLHTFYIFQSDKNMKNQCIQLGQFIHVLP